MPTDTNQLKFRRIELAEDLGFDSLFQIYKEAFPASERKDHAHLVAMIRRPEYIFLTASLDEAVVGFVIMIAFPDSAAALLEYFAVDKKHRGQGLGKQIFIAAAHDTRIGDRFLLLEVESDKLPSRGQQTIKRRKDFYKRLGCKEIELLDYIMPKVSEAAPPPMDLMVFKTTLPDSIEAKLLESWLKDCYVRVYDRASDDPHIRKMLNRLPATLRLI